MSSVAEMSALVHEAADHSSPSGNWKDRVQAAARVLRMPFGRAKRHYYQEVRRVDAEEMDRARREIKRLRDQAELRKNSEHVEWVGRTLAYLETSDPELYRPEIAALERTLHAVGSPGGAMAVSRETSEDEAMK